MNSQIIPQGPAETLEGPATVTRTVLVGEAWTACAVADLVELFAASPANGAAVATGTIPINGRLTNMKTFTLTTGTMRVIYRA